LILIAPIIAYMSVYALTFGTRIFSHSSRLSTPSEFASIAARSYFHSSSVKTML
jgi:hypothetical protein